MCTHRRNCCILLEFINYAPCPPPFLSCENFKEIAIDRGLKQTEICSIAQRCKAKRDLSMNMDCLQCISENESDSTLIFENKILIIVLCVVGLASVAVVTLICYVCRKYKCHTCERSCCNFCRSKPSSVDRSGSGIPLGENSKEGQDQDLGNEEDKDDANDDKETKSL